MSCVHPLLRPSLRESPVATCGFRQQFRCDDVIGILRQVIFVSYRWGRPLVVAAADVLTAFDCMNHGSMEKSLLGRGCHPVMARALLREVSGMSCNIEINGAGISETFPLERGGKQGGIETPEVFNAMMEYALEPVFRSWLARGFRVAVSELDEGSPALTHLLWADNIILVSERSTIRDHGK